MTGSNIALIKGGGDLATGVALRLRQHGWQVVVTELAQPLVVRRTVAVASAIYEGQITIEGVTARHVSAEAEVLAAWAAGIIPVLVDPAADLARRLAPRVVVDAIMAKLNSGTRLAEAPIVVALGPGFCAGVDCHAVVETQRGPSLGQAFFTGSAAPDSGQPGAIEGETVRRLLRAPRAGAFTSQARIGDHVRLGQIVATIEGEPVAAGLQGIVRGLLADGVRVPAGTKIGDVDPRDDPALCHRISDKAWKIADGVLAAIGALERQP